jgi:KaiC/GvpD/RAD55 family RecA-like ATPase
MAHQLEDVDEPLRILLYGEGGTGKTTHLCHMADLGKILVINAEAGVKARALRACGVNTKNIEVFPSADETISFDSLEAEWKRVYEAVSKKPNAYVGVVWDSLTEIYSVLLDQARADAYKRSQRGVKPRESEFFTDRSDYGVMAEQFRKLIRKFRDLPCHLGASALERREVDENDGEVKYLPSVTPALQKDLYLWFDIIGHTTVKIDEESKEEQYRSAFRPVSKYSGKDRFKATPIELVEPTFTRVLKYVDGSLTLENDPVIKAAKAAKAARARAK